MVRICPGWSGDARPPGRVGYCQNQRVQKTALYIPTRSDKLGLQVEVRETVLDVQTEFQRVQVLDTPGHTAGHITYVIPSAKVAFVGDTLFALGCGRVIEGNPEMMWGSLKKLMALPKDTAVYCGHEYTQANAKFALTIEPDSPALQKRAKEVDAMRAAGKATLPSTIGLELETNPFLRPHVPAIQKRLGMEGKPEWQIFAEIRERKNKF